jgi:4-amino-4-deoxy-L-arabinose transferase-like glycosyltransferase
MNQTPLPVQRIDTLAPLPPLARWLTLLLPLLLLTFNLAGAPLFNVDEGAFSEATREMFTRHDFLSTWLNGAPRFDKPILIYWFQAACFWLLQTTDAAPEWAFRLPSAIAAALWCHAIAVFAAPRWGRRTALFACGIAATSFGVFVIGRAATADALLNLLIALTLFDAWRALERSDNNDRRLPNKPWHSPLHRAYFWIALGVLTKGPVAILIPVAVVLLYGLSGRQTGKSLRLFFDPWGWLVLLVVAAPWYIAIYLAQGQAFIDGFIMKHNVERFSGTLQGHSGSAFYYLLMVPLLLLPWLPWLLAAVARSWADRADALHCFLWLWCLFVIGFFSLSGTKLPHYALYGCTPLFLLCAAQFQRVRNPVLAGLPVLLMLALVLVLPNLLSYAAAAGWVKDAYYQLQIARAAEAVPAGYRIAAAAALVLALAVLAWPLFGSLFGKARPLWQRAVMAAVLNTLLLAGMAAPYLGDVLEGPVKRAALFARNLPDPAVQWNFHMPSFSVYRQRVTPLRAPQPGELALVRVDRLPAKVAVETLYREAGVALVRVPVTVPEAPSTTAPVAPVAP